MVRAHREFRVRIKRLPEWKSRRIQEKRIIMAKKKIAAKKKAGGSRKTAGKKKATKKPKAAANKRVVFSRKTTRVTRIAPREISSGSERSSLGSNRLTRAIRPPQRGTGDEAGGQA